MGDMKPDPSVLINPKDAVAGLPAASRFRMCSENLVLDGENPSVLAASCLVAVSGKAVP
jgi:hypothetical protein